MLNLSYELGDDFCLLQGGIRVPLVHYRHESKPRPGELALAQNGLQYEAVDRLEPILAEDLRGESTHVRVHPARPLNEHASLRQHRRAIVKDHPPADPARTRYENFGREVITVVRTEGRSRRIWIVVAVVVVAVVAVVAYLLLYNGGTGTGGGGSGGGGGYFFVALSMSQRRWIGRKLRSIRA